MNDMSHFHRDPSIVNGQWVIKGTRVTLRTILATLAEGATEEEILRDFPSLAQEDVRSVMAFAAESAADEPAAVGGSRK